MKYAPDEEGNFAGQIGYGYISFEKFIDAVNGLNEGKLTLEQLDARPYQPSRTPLQRLRFLRLEDDHWMKTDQSRLSKRTASGR
jgi:hypothetical protein